MVLGIVARSVRPDVNAIFAQWCSIVAVVAAGYVAVVLWKKGTPAPLAADLGGRPGGRQATLVAMAKAKSEGNKS